MPTLADLQTFLLTTLILAVVALLACYILFTASHRSRSGKGAEIRIDPVRRKAMGRVKTN
jgi:hypothetical protein